MRILLGDAGGEKIPASANILFTDIEENRHLIFQEKKLLLLTLSTSIVFLRERYQTNLNHLCLTFSFDLNSSFKLSNCFRSFRRFSLKTILITITQQTNAKFIYISYIKRTEDKSEQFWRY